MDLNKNVSQKSSTRPDLSASDIVDLIVEDHQVLKECIRVMKDVENSREERQAAAETFAVQLVAHERLERETMGQNFLEEKSKILEMGGDDAPPEKSMH